MPPAVCFYFQVHQPYRLKDLRITDVGTMNSAYFDIEKNRSVFRKVAEKCYLPANALMLDLLERHKDFRIAYSLSGVFLDQCREYGEDVLESFRALVQTGRVELLGETYYHSLSAVFSLSEFCEQVSKHSEKIRSLFGVVPTVFRNTELIYNNEIANIVRLLGFKGILAEGVDRLLAGRSPNVVYRAPTFDFPLDWQATIKRYRIHSRPLKTISVLLKNYRLSDDIAFRFSDKSWVGHPLMSNVFAEWVSASEGSTVNLFMDYETFGEHQWAETGIFEFLRHLPAAFKTSGIATKNPSEVVRSSVKKLQDTLDAHHLISWADTERDLSAWRSNYLQEAALTGIYALEPAVKTIGDPVLLDIWRKLQTSDHFYYLCTKYWNDGDVHKYFSPYESPFEAYRRFSHALADLKLIIERALELVHKTSHS
ncbi:alpha-amylase [Candidatus Peribacteria bacterium]|nr:alpha-amylase [Candidatus Peribacteria bacterium]